MVTFRLIEGTSKYYAGDDGHIYYQTKDGMRKRTPAIQSNGRYYKLALYRYGKRTDFRVHRLICETWHGIPLSNMTVSHLDGDWTNNKPENLRWETLKDNTKRKLEHGTDDIGYKNSRAKITQEQLTEIRHLLETTDLTHKEIGAMFGVNRVFITKINIGYRYKGQT